MTISGNRAQIPRGKHPRGHALSTGQRHREILEICRQTPAKLKILPGVYQLIGGQVSVSKIRDVQLEDLLHRDPVQLNLEEISEYLHNKTVLVTGAGGSIGSELCRQICRFRPQKIVLVDNCENNLYDINLELEDKFPGAKRIPCLTDIKEVEKVARYLKSIIRKSCFTPRRTNTCP